VLINIILDVLDIGVVTFWLQYNAILDFECHSC
jgi:hypothetical protein